MGFDNGAYGICDRLQFFQYAAVTPKANGQHALTQGGMGKITPIGTIQDEGRRRIGELPVSHPLQTDEP